MSLTVDVAKIDRLLTEMERCCSTDAVVTLVVRVPGNPDAELVLTNGDCVGAMEVLGRALGSWENPANGLCRSSGSDVRERADGRASPSGWGARTE